MGNLELIIQEKQIELRNLQSELSEALGESETPDYPDYETASRLQRIINRVKQEIERLEKLRLVKPAPQEFQSYLSRLLTDDTVAVLELWAHLKNYWSDETIRLLEIQKLKGRYTKCTLRLLKSMDKHLDVEWTATQLQHIGWKTLRSKRTFYYKTMMRSPDQFDAFCQMMSVTLMEPFEGLWRCGEQYYRYR